MNRICMYSIGTAVGGILLLGCWFLFDHKRRKDLNFRKKQKLNRKCDEKLRELIRSDQKVFPTRCTAEDLLIIHELQIGEVLLTKKNVEEAIDHFVNAIRACSDPENFLRVLKTNLNPAMYHKLLDVLKKDNDFIVMENDPKKQDPFEAKSHTIIKS